MMQAVERDTGADLHLAIAGRQGIVEDGVVGEVAHTEAVEPFQQAWLSLARLFELDANLAGIHDAFSLAEKEHHRQGCRQRLHPSMVYRSRISLYALRATF